MTCHEPRDYVLAKIEEARRILSRMVKHTMRYDNDAALVDAAHLLAILYDIEEDRKRLLKELEELRKESRGEEAEG